MGTHELLAPFNPLLKFMVVKMVVFLTFWQVRRPKLCVSYGAALHLARSWSQCAWLPSCGACVCNQSSLQMCAAYARITQQV